MYNSKHVADAKSSHTCGHTGKIISSSMSSEVGRGGTPFTQQSDEHIHSFLTLFTPQIIKLHTPFLSKSSQHLLKSSTYDPGRVSDAGDASACSYTHTPSYKKNTDTTLASYVWWSCDPQGP